MTSSFSHSSYQNQHSCSNNKKDESHLFLHPSRLGDSYRQIQDAFPTSANNAATATNNNNQQQQGPCVCIILSIIFKIKNKIL